MAHCLHKLVGPTSRKAKNAKGQKKEKIVAVPNQTEEEVFEWTPKDQQVFSVLKEALVTAPTLGYAHFNR